MMEPRTPSATGHQERRNIISTKPGTMRFILACVNDKKDVFQELWGHQNFNNIMNFTLAEAQRQEDEAFSLSKKQVKCIFWSVHTLWCVERGI